jgi:hypothetical protein
MGENRRFFAKPQNFQSIIGRVRHYFFEKILMQKFLARTIVIESDRAISIFKNDPFSLHPNVHILSVNYMSVDIGIFLLLYIVAFQ